MSQDNSVISRFLSITALLFEHSGVKLMQSEIIAAHRPVEADGLEACHQLFGIADHRFEIIDDVLVIGDNH